MNAGDPMEKNANYFQISFDYFKENYADALTGALQLQTDWQPLQCNNADYGIYLSTNTAGVKESVAFWKEVLLKTPSFANPANFPWTLANAPASLIAKWYGVKGPVYSFVGKEEATSASVIQAEIDLENELIKEAWIIRLDITGSTVLVHGFRTSMIVSMEETQNLLKTFHAATGVLSDVSIADPAEMISGLNK